MSNAHIMQIPSRETGEIFRSNTNTNEYIKLLNKNGAMWNYAKYLNPEIILTEEIASDYNSWSYEQVSEKEPPISEWTLHAHYSLYDPTERCVVVNEVPKYEKIWYDIKKNTLYRGFRKRKKIDGDQDIEIPTELVKRLHLASTIKSDDKEKEYVDYINPDGHLVRNNTEDNAIGNDYWYEEINIIGNPEGTNE